MVVLFGSFMVVLFAIMVVALVVRYIIKHPCLTLGKGSLLMTDDTQGKIFYIFCVPVWLSKPQLTNILFWPNFKGRFWDQHNNKNIIEKNNNNSISAITDLIMTKHLWKVCSTNNNNNSNIINNNNKISTAKLSSLGASDLHLLTTTKYDMICRVTTTN